jgi:site-specific DNA-methyltransferase (adenine-specific)
MEAFTSKQRWRTTGALVENSNSPNATTLANVGTGTWLIEGDTFRVLDSLLAGGLQGQVDLVFADPPYFLGKATWDKPRVVESAFAFHEEWLAICRDMLADHGTLWVCGGYSDIHTTGYVLQRLGMKILSQVTWEKVNPPPNRTRRCFVHATETLLWAAKRPGAPHRFNYACMREQNGGKQMRSHWRMGPPRAAERLHGRHPTQKPLALVERCLLSTTGESDLVLDPFVGSGTTAVAARRLGRACIGIDGHRPYLEIARRRLDDVDAEAWS